MADYLAVVRVYRVLVYDYLCKGAIEIFVYDIEDVAFGIVMGIAYARGFQPFEIVVFALSVGVAIEFYLLVAVDGEVNEDAVSFPKAGKFYEITVSVPVGKFGSYAVIANIVLVSWRVFSPHADKQQVIAMFGIYPLFRPCEFFFGLPYLLLRNDIINRIIQSLVMEVVFVVSVATTVCEGNRIA